MRHLIFALAAATVALTPIGAAAQSPLGFFFQALNPSAAVAPPPAPGERRVYAPTAYQRPPSFPAPQARNAPPPPPFRGFWSNDWRQRFAAVPPQTPEKAAVPEHLQRQRVAVDFNEQPGTVIIDTNARYLYLIQEGGMAMRYGVGVGREGFGWNGTAKIGHKAEWPTWTPPEEMRRREPWLPESMEGGLDNPLGARALYLYEGSKDTLYRIHGTNQPETIGQAVSSGCIRMLNDDVVDLYQRVPIGTKVVVI